MTAKGLWKSWRGQAEPGRRKEQARELGGAANSLCG